MTATQRKARDEKPRALALPGGRCLDRATDALYEAGYYENVHFSTAPVRAGGETFPGIRSSRDDREVLGQIAKQLVIVGIPFRLVTAR